jgi:hypothetical protein
LRELLLLLTPGGNHMIFSTALQMLLAFMMTLEMVFQLIQKDLNLNIKALDGKEAKDSSASMIGSMSQVSVITLMFRKMFLFQELT